jgi:hypothetical protein
MNRKSAFKPGDGKNRSRAAKRALNVTVVYQDAPTRRWAGQLCDRVETLVGAENVRCTWWKMLDLGEPGVLAGAVSLALRADVIVVAFHAVEQLPLPFYVWVEAWLPHRLAAAGSLLALIDLPRQPTARSDEAREYLRAIARQARLDFLTEERRLPVEPFSLRRRAPAEAPRGQAPSPQLETA